MVFFKRIVLAGYYGYGNGGDELILQSILNGFEKNISDTEVVVLARYPMFNYVLGKHLTGRNIFNNAKFINRYDPFSIISNIASSDALVMGGGSLLQDVTGFFSIYYYFALMGMAKLMRKKLIIFNQGMGPIKNNVNRFIAKCIFMNTDLIIVRDDYSKKFIERITRKRCRVLIGADPIFSKSVPDNISCRKIPGKIGFSIRNWKGYSVKKKFLEIGIKLKNAGWECHNFPFHIPEDEMGEGDIKNVSWSRPGELFKIMSGFDAVIGMRLHSLIIGVLLNIPMVGIGYDPKVKNFCNFMSISCLEIDELDPDRIKDELETACFRKNGYKAARRVLRERVKYSWEELIKQVRV